MKLLEKGFYGRKVEEVLAVIVLGSDKVRFALAINLGGDPLLMIKGRFDVLYDDGCVTTSSSMDSAV